MAPMSLFHTELLDVTTSNRPQRLRTMDKNDGDPEDPYDDVFDTNNFRKVIKVRTKLK